MIARIFILIVFAGILGTGYYLASAGIWGESRDLTSIRTGSAGAGFYSSSSVK